MKTNRDDFLHKIDELKKLDATYVARRSAIANDLEAMAAGLPAPPPKDEVTCPVDRCQLSLPERRLGDHLRNVHGDEIYESWILQHPEHTADLELGEA